jgi:uncharacterized protein YjiK
MLLALTTACAKAETPERMTIGGYGYPVSESVRYKLPKALREISGLTLDDEGHLYGHADERGIVYRIDYRKGQVVSRFALEGDVRADFEGIAWLNEHLYLTTSNGRIYRTRPGSADAWMPFHAYDAELDCEVESLARDPSANRLLAACKNRPDGGKALHIYAWNPENGRWSAAPIIRLKRSALTDVFAGIGLPSPKKLQPTAMTTTSTGNLLLIAGPQKVLLELSPTGEPIAAARLDPGAHRQPEGLEMTAEGTLIIADEGDNKGANKSRGRLSIYEHEG